MNSKQVAEIFHLSIDTLRYYERVGAIPPIERDENGYRNYQTGDMNWIFLARNLRAAGLSMEALIGFSKLAQLGAVQDVSAAQKAILNDQLEKINEKMEELSKVRRILEYKIDTYDDHLAKALSGELTGENAEKMWEIDYYHLKNEQQPVII